MSRLSNTAQWGLQTNLVNSICSPCTVAPSLQKDGVGGVQKGVGGTQEGVCSMQEEVGGSQEGGGGTLDGAAEGCHSALAAVGCKPADSVR